MEKSRTRKSQPGAIRQRNEARILTAAADEFVKCGYKGTSVQSIADRVSLPKANVLYYFKSKKGIYFAVLEEILNLWNQGFDDATDIMNPVEVIECYIRGKMKYSRTHPKESKIFALELINGAQNISDAMNLPMVNWTAGKVDIIQAWVDNGLIRPIDPLYLLFLIWGTTQFYADCDVEIYMIKGRPLNDDEFEAATQFVIDTVLRGLDLKK
ncbi:TetR family transcriptional regulator C-terminal domain-containing protein [Vibrio salinus]|uniref:TetR family transcriptional regulator C-terminal domain-containing protein n=1 Tax=Vibrio salinus TaxID=2899784 RepID=UPI001E52F4C7|nr:TetR family transcriptional regulator C-terminal domain-containing protein [Vibrio salinus]MCE0495376.1 TetR family transcriptional regulator C-terminal domain-containing protein [Vibrio salinus]